VKSNHWGLGVFIAITLSACGNKNPFAGRERHQAPRGAKDVGVLVEKSSEAEVANLLDKHPNAQVRVLSKAHGLYEIFGVSKSEVRKEVSGPVNDNQFFQLLEPAVPSMLSVSAPVGLEIEGLNKCKAGPSAPTAVLTVREPATALNGATLELGQIIKLNALNSKAAAGLAPDLKIALLINRPSASAAGNQLLHDGEYAFTPDALGVYEIILVVQDSRDVCALDGARFMVTANKPYNGPKAKELSFNLAAMKHLAEVQAEESWQESQGEGVIIAVIDSGVNYNHPSLAPNMLVNDKEIPGNGIDDDGNGLKDDYIGYDFANDDAFPYDDVGHGSHVAGLAAGKQFGLAKKAKILAIKALSGIGGDVGTASAAVRYAVDRGAKIINLSLGGPSPLPHPAIVSAMAYAASKNVLVIASAGNGDPQTGLGYSIDEVPFFPAALPDANLVSVASFDTKSVLSPYSNFGKANVDVVAPGGNMPYDPMFSCAYENPRNALFVGMSGTSMAAPVVSGIAAQVISLRPHLTVSEVKTILMTAGPEKPDLVSVTGSGRHINALDALALAKERDVLF
jgi:subtilisin family serine protease